MKIAAAIISALFTLGQGVIWFFITLVALNGFSEEADAAILIFGGIVLVTVIASGFAGCTIASRLLARSPKLLGWTVLIVVGLTSLLAAVVFFLGVLVAVGVASALHG